MIGMPIVFASASASAEACEVYKVRIIVPFLNRALVHSCPNTSIPHTLSPLHCNMGHFRRSVLGGLAVGIVAQSVMAGPYTIAQTNVGSDFFNNFQWENISDPTNGRV